MVVVEERHISGLRSRIVGMFAVRARRPQRVVAVTLLLRVRHEHPAGKRTADHFVDFTDPETGKPRTNDA
jgi:hypothetical protein